jgi:hypothetical protein
MCVSGWSERLTTSPTVPIYNNTKIRLNPPLFVVRHDNGLLWGLGRGSMLLPVLQGVV